MDDDETVDSSDWSDAEVDAYIETQDPGTFYGDDFTPTNDVAYSSDYYAMENGAVVADDTKWDAGGVAIGTEGFYNSTLYDFEPETTLLQDLFSWIPGVGGAKDSFDMDRTDEAQDRLAYMEQQGELEPGWKDGNASFTSKEAFDSYQRFRSSLYNTPEYEGNKLSASEKYDKRTKDEDNNAWKLLLAGGTIALSWWNAKEQRDLQLDLYERQRKDTYDAMYFRKYGHLPGGTSESSGGSSEATVAPSRSVIRSL